MIDTDKRMRRVFQFSFNKFTITIPISEHDIDLFKQLVNDGEAFEWSFGSTIVKFVRQEGDE